MPNDRFNAVISQKIEVALGLIVLRVAPEGWELPAFEPGQFAVLGLPADAARCEIADPLGEEPVKPGKLIRRAYSVASSSVSREYLEFYVNLVYSGLLTPRLFALKPGDRVWLGPKFAGAFTLDQAPADAHVALVATGTGLAPYMSMLRTVLPERDGRRIAVLLGARHSWDLGYHAELVTMDRLCENFHYIPTISRPDEEMVGWVGASGYVMDLWRAGVLVSAWGSRPTPEDTRVFLCGNPHMIDAMSELLAADGFREHSRKVPGEVFVERYW